MYSLSSYAVHVNLSTGNEMRMGTVLTAIARSASALMHREGHCRA